MKSILSHILRCLMGLCLLSAMAWAQHSPFQIEIEEMDLPGMPGLHSFAFGQSDGNWLLVGGRVDGLHRRQPFAAFDSVGRNTLLSVVDPRRKEVWSVNLSSLPVAMQEQLSATNPQFHQVGAKLYVLGGYGYSPSEGDHKTFGLLTEIDVPGMISAIQNKTDLNPHIRQLADPRFAVTGGQLERIEDIFYLVGGHNFNGRYNPNGPDFGPGFQQQYNLELISFRLLSLGESLQVVHFPGPIDSVHLHRRDFNMSPQIMPDGHEGLLAFSGVFQYKADIPYLNLVEIIGNGYRIPPAFQQHYQQYHCAKLPLYAAKAAQMHTLFLGGISEYYDSAGIHTLDCNVPFVKTVARVTRDAQGNYLEYKLPIEMPDYLGASGEFIIAPDLPQYPNGVVKLDELPASRSLVGYIVGGIQSSDDNIFWANEGAHSTANAKVYKVYLRKENGLPEEYRNPSSSDGYELEVLPDPYKGLLSLDFVVPGGELTLLLSTESGRKVLEYKQNYAAGGRQHLALACKRLKKGGVFNLRFQLDDEVQNLRIIVQP